MEKRGFIWLEPLYHSTQHRLVFSTARAMFCTCRQHGGGASFARPQKHTIDHIMLDEKKIKNFCSIKNFFSPRLRDEIRKC